MTNTAKQMAEGHLDQAGRGVSGAARMVDERTGDTYDAKTGGAVDAVRPSHRDGGGTQRRPDTPGLPPPVRGGGRRAQPGAPARPTT
ncbi:antitoxin [Streptomyces roseolilacinus]|uniref:antitoxin n=1 Tax=Streptomyces roseolilacinus TaxID=66904 RepID=UPI0038034D5C